MINTGDEVVTRTGGRFYESVRRCDSQTPSFGCVLGADGRENIWKDSRFFNLSVPPELRPSTSAPCASSAISYPKVSAYLPMSQSYDLSLAVGSLSGPLGLCKFSIGSGFVANSLASQAVQGPSVDNVLGSFFALFEQMIVPPNVVEGFQVASEGNSVEPNTITDYVGQLATGYYSLGVTRLYNLVLTVVPCPQCPALVYAPNLTFWSSSCTTPACGPATPGGRDAFVTDHDRSASGRLAHALLYSQRSPVPRSRAPDDRLVASAPPTSSPQDPASICQMLLILFLGMYPLAPAPLLPPPIMFFAIILFSRQSASHAKSALPPSPGSQAVSSPDRTITHRFQIVNSIPLFAPRQPPALRTYIYSSLPFLVRDGRKHISPATTISISRQANLSCRQADNLRIFNDARPRPPNTHGNHGAFRIT
ncbi:hypothetical protein BDK51DRAFT_39502 [Blyttiomyces helicus]|uniref:Uncharacterized protein n=1 Tax=Blyttiomyces helicus TaxID=388810 RepID=A0A4P9WDL5_9FUNG|nr:hypothetical protein BDK51DRAFT_39502 [Blyttiomyces helicus]|eukprot:RKO88446.1 hypothetical protein BDK51DRAFT_39502 [Blyttiomyces helicus]